ncbi:hypothetical protein, partial [Pseudomonas parasichuanensis]|uniref:hypothetical protein n=1 Tax=Pseudomonas parasichuanensis TaxID=2892329 RepID=UPI001F48AB92
AGILVLLSLRDDTRQALVVTPIWFVLLAVTYQFVRSKRQPRAALDFIGAATLPSSSSKSCPCAQPCSNPSSTASANANPFS